MHVRSELNFLQYVGKGTKQDSNQLAQEYSHHASQRQHIPPSWKRNYVTAASPPAIPAEQHHFYQARTTAKFQKEKKKNASSQFIS